MLWQNSLKTRTKPGVAPEKESDMKKHAQKKIALESVTKNHVIVADMFFANDASIKPVTAENALPRRAVRTFNRKTGRRNPKGWYPLVAYKTTKGYYEFLVPVSVLSSWYCQDLSDSYFRLNREGVYRPRTGQSGISPYRLFVHSSQLNKLIAHMEKYHPEYSPCSNILYTLFAFSAGMKLGEFSNFRDGSTGMKMSRVFERIFIGFFELFRSVPTSDLYATFSGDRYDPLRIQNLLHVLMDINNGRGIQYPYLELALRKAYRTAFRFGVEWLAQDDSWGFDTHLFAGFDRFLNDHIPEWRDQELVTIFRDINSINYPGPIEMLRLEWKDQVEKEKAI